MRFDIAVAAILVAEGLSSSVDAAAQGTPHASDLQESARLRKEAIEAISNMNPNGRREYRMFQRTRQQQQQQLRNGRILREGRNLFEDKIRQFSEDRLQQFSDTATTVTNQQRKNKGTTGDDPISDSDFPDLGILLSTPTKEQQRNRRKDKIIQHLSSITNSQQQLQNKRTSGDSGPSSHSAVPDLGILPSVSTKEKGNILKDRIQKLLGAANPRRKKGSSSGDLATSSNGTLPDLGIISSAPSKDQHNDKIPLGSIPSTYHKDYRRLQEGPVDNSIEDVSESLEDALTKPVAFAGTAICAGLKSIDIYSGAATPSCETCQVTYVDDNDPESAYDLEIDCPNIPQEYADGFLYGLSSLEDICSYGVCQEICSVDTENFLVDMKDCSFAESFDDMSESLGYALTKPVAFAGTAICAGLKSIDTNSGAATPSCDTCQVTYVDDNDPESAYDLEIDCPNIPQEYAEDFLYSLSSLKDICSNGMCQACSVDTENFLAEMKDCSFAEYFDDMSESLGNIKPVAFTGNLICAQLKSVDIYIGAATPSCDTCQVTYVDDNDPESAYDLEIDCPNVPQFYADGLLYSLSSLKDICPYGLCEESCSVDTENFLVDMKDCSVAEYYANALTKPVAVAGNSYCAYLKSIDTNSGAATPSCDTCQVTYVDDNDPESAYDLEIDCPNIPQEYADGFLYTLSLFEAVCSNFVCQESCIVDTKNFLVDMKDCSSSNSGYDFESLLDFVNMTNGTTDDISGAYRVETLASVFDYYFSSFCEPPEGVDQEFTCKACGQKSSDESSSFSFEFDCPQSDNGFGAYMILADYFCNCPALLGVQCSICEVNPWEATINIEDCVPIAKEEQAYCSNRLDLVYSDQTAFIANYERVCNPVESYYLQDSINAADCDCTFDESTQTASFSCQYEEVCQDISSYCPENPLEFCTSYRIDASVARYGTVSLHRCVNFSSPYQFSYCVNYGTTEDGAAAAAATVPNDTTKPQGYPVCEMEVDGIRCNSCSLVNYEKSNKTGIFSAIEDMNVYYNCSNTVVGTNGQGNLSYYKIFDDTVSYFIYKSLPCPGGCDLCGVGEMFAGNGGPKNEFMAKPDGIFASEFWKNGTEERCFDAQLDAMTRKQILNNEECQAIRDIAREPCGCKNPNPQSPASGAHSFDKRKTTVGAVLFTMAAASLVQMLLG
jgi:hypothetical protein